MRRGQGRNLARWSKIAPPPSVDFGALESDTTMYAFDEQQNVTLAQALEVDITAPGTYDDSSDLTPGTIPGGTGVSSHFVTPTTWAYKPRPPCSKARSRPTRTSSGL